MEKIGLKNAPLATINYIPGFIKYTYTQTHTRTPTRTHTYKCEHIKFQQSPPQRKEKKWTN